jgi:hypothetical protein
LTPPGKQDASSATFEPWLVIVPEQLGPVAPLATMLARRFTVPLWLRTPPSVGAELPLNVVKVYVDVPPTVLRAPPPPRMAVLPLMVLFVTATVPPSLSMPPPNSSTPLPLMVLPVTVSVLPFWLKMPPPSLLALLLLMLLFVTVSLPPSLRMPPPTSSLTTLPLMTLFVTVSVPRLRMPPPPTPRGILPFRTVSPLTSTVKGFTANTRFAALPSTIVLDAPFPTIRRSLSITIWPSVSTIGMPSVPAAKVIWSVPLPAGQPPKAASVSAASTASRSEQAPGLVLFSSAVVVTWIVAAKAALVGTRANRPARSTSGSRRSERD